MDWFRMYGEFANDPKVQMMSENMQRRLIMVFCLNSDETLVTLHEKELAFVLRISDEDLAETKKLFLSKGFIDDNWNPSNWDKRQKRSDSSKERVKRYRQKNKKGVETLHETDETLHVTKCNALDQTRSDQIRKEYTKDPITPDSQYLKSNSLYSEQPYGSGWDIQKLLSPNKLEVMQENAQLLGWDWDFILQRYHYFAKVPPDYPDKAFNTWFFKFTKGKSPT